MASRRMSIALRQWKLSPMDLPSHSLLGQQPPSEFVAGWQQTRTDQKAGFLTLDIVQ